MVQKYQKKPVTIEAIRFTEENLPIIKEWLGENLAQLSSEDRYRNPQNHWIIRDYLEGDMKISDGDFIIKGVKGEFYPCKPDIFYATYNGPVKVLWDHTTGEYDPEYLKQQDSIDAGRFLSDLLTKDLEELGDADLEPREEATMVLKLKEDPDPNTIYFRWDDTNEVILRISKDGFYYRGESVEDIHNVYERFNEWLTRVEGEKQVSNPEEEKWENFTKEFNKTRIDNINW